ncbi:MAG: hypothetical protein GY806_20470 [Gammaproteobacteria bacterium]|nr:hypothetical protein [Gammaproteobacteria bacterium]
MPRMRSPKTYLQGAAKLQMLVDRGYVTGNQIGIVGTSALFKGNGEKIEGYVPH